MRRALLAIGASIGLGAASPPPEITSTFDEAPFQSGTATYRFARLPLYDAALWTSAPEFSWEQPFALTLEYRRGFRAQTLANTSVREMARIAGTPTERFEPLSQPLSECFADVEPGDRITGVAARPDLAMFYLNGEKRCELNHPDVRDSFFRIWLDDASRFQKQSRALRGLGDG